MGHLKVPANIMKDKSGSAVMLLGLLFIFGLFLFTLITLDYMVLKTNMEKSKDAVTAACLAGLGEINQEALSYNIIELEHASAEATFLTYLEDNIEDISNSPPVVEEFIIYNESDLPAVCPGGKTLNYPAIHTVIQITLDRPILSGILGSGYIFRIHYDGISSLE